MRGVHDRKPAGNVARVGKVKNGVKIKERESVILAQILRYLEMRRILHWRMPVQGVMRSSRGRVSFSKSPIAGFPDIAGIHHGMFFALEVKTSSGKVSDLQDAWLRDLNSAGGYACVVRSLADADHALETVKHRAKLTLYQTSA